MPRDLLTIILNIIILKIALVNSYLDNNISYKMTVIKEIQLNKDPLS